MKLIENQSFDKERAFYGSEDVTVKNCSFDGPADGESAFKESRQVVAQSCYFNLRYPFWHDHGLTILQSEMTPLCRAALWYSEDIDISDTKLHGIKALRECQHVSLKDCDIVSPEFGWMTRQIRMERCTAESEYFFMRSEALSLKDVSMKGKYSFQYIQDAQLENCHLDTKDAFWHATDVTVKDSVIKGEYLAWYSKNLTLIRCKIIGTQPFCYCKNLRLIDCEMVDTDLCFEKSQVEATITTPVVSIKNPASGKIFVPSVGEIIRDCPGADGEIILNSAGHSWHI